VPFLRIFPCLRLLRGSIVPRHGCHVVVALGRSPPLTAQRIPKDRGDLPSLSDAGAVADEEAGAVGAAAAGPVPPAFFPAGPRGGVDQEAVVTVYREAGSLELQR